MSPGNERPAPRREPPVDAEPVRNGSPMSVDDRPTVPPPCQSRTACEQVRREAACWREEFTEERVRERLAEDDALVLLRLRLGSWDVSDAWREQRANPPGPWPADAAVPPGFYPPRGAA